MSLATRCPACGTIFRVVQDQLKVSEGWVRCGQCHEVFHGIEALFDLDSDPTIAARRAASRQPVAAPPPTRVFAQQRANAPIPPIPSAPTPPAPAPVVFAPRPATPPQAAPAQQAAPAVQSVPATPSAFGRANPPAPAPAPVRPGFTGFTPATRPMPPAPERPAALAPAMSPPPAPLPPAPAPQVRPPVTPSAASPVPQVTTRTTIAPRFAARLAEEAARAQAAAAAVSPPPPSSIVVTPPVTTTRAMPLSAPSSPQPPSPPAAPVPLGPPPAPISVASPPITFMPTPPAQQRPAVSPAPAPAYKTTAPAPLFKPTVPATMSPPSAPTPFSVPSAPVPISTPDEFDLGPLDEESIPVHGTYAPTAPMSLDSLTELAALEPLKPPPPVRPSAPMPFGAPSAPVPFGGRATAPVPFGGRASAPVPLGTPSAPAPFDFARRAEEAASRWQTQPIPLQPRGLAAPPPAQTPASWFAPPPAQVAPTAPIAPVVPAAPIADPVEAAPRSTPVPQAAPAAWFAPPAIPVATPAPAPVVEPPAATPTVEAAAVSAAEPAPAPEPTAPAEPIYIPPSLLARRPAPAPEPPPAPAPVAKAEPELPLITPIVEAAPELAPAPEPSAVDLAADFAAAPAAATTPAPDSALSGLDSIIIDGLGEVSDFEVIEPAPEVGGTTIPSRLADDIEEELRAGPPTLASMLPEDAGEWPPKKGKKRRDKVAATVAPESALIDKTKDPRFLREARSGARWRRPWVRATLSLVLVVLVVGAAAQVAWPLRDAIAARWPATQPAWAWVCAQADCKIEAPRAIASLALDGSSLTRTDTEHVLLFSADLHNRADHDVLMPSFDVSFTDLNGAIVARKVLSPEQLGIHQESLPALGELHVHARLQVGTLPASGFQADLFYP